MGQGSFQAIMAAGVLGAATAVAGHAQQAAQTPATVAPYFTPAAAAATTPDEEGFIRRWLLLEPISKPNRTNAVFTGSYVRSALSPATYPGKFTAVPRDGERAPGPPPLAWHALDSTMFDVKLFNFAQALNKEKYGVIFWAVTVIDSPREMKDVRLAVGSNSASIWWINGQEAAALFNDRRMVMDDVVSDRLTLRKGRNVIRGAVINGPGLSDFCVRIIDEDGRPVRNVSVDVK
jgi:hypothetical protein